MTATLNRKNRLQTEAISSRDEFADFVKALAKDRRDNPGAWENERLDSFLDALGAWLHDTSHETSPFRPSEPSGMTYQNAAEMLLAARSYE